MLTLKDWNSLDSGRRKIDWEGKPGTYQEGRWYKLMLSHCFKQKGDRIKVTLIV